MAVAVGVIVERKKPAIDAILAVFGEMTARAVFPVSVDDLRREIDRRVADGVMLSPWGDGRPRHALHPLGQGADRRADQHTAANRAALRRCLEAYWAGTLATRVNRPHGDAAVGMELADRFVSLLEVGTSLQLLRLDHPDLAALLEWRYRDGWTVAQVCARLHETTATYYRRETSALDVLIDAIFFDLDS